MVEKVERAELAERVETVERVETADEVAARHGLRPLPVEGGLFRRTWVGPPDADGRPAGSAILVLLTTAPGDFSALHRLPTDEVWHFYEGDALELLLLAPDGTDRLAVLGRAGCVQLVVPAGTWMGARVAPGPDDGGRYGWSLFGTTMAPGFLSEDYEGGDPDELAARYPGRARLIRELCRPGEPVRMGREGAAGGFDA
ncbi:MULTISPECIES: cupin domain-containing protein [unclassified Streptomyces]|uniref:cupin domain-containing protein n=1 Tax=unclassified Streptomyces TaxID=2593676 RepID=UPI001CBE3E9C|nr:MULTISPECIES: cupin domain-containing protein [unclassified Streptomyces]WPO72311.1 cupin domain-containing protein [Streptomyces sp. KN37]